MSEELTDAMAARVAVAVNGGAWSTHYTESQKEVWRKRVAAIVGETK